MKQIFLKLCHASWSLLPTSELADKQINFKEDLHTVFSLKIIDLKRKPAQTLSCNVYWIQMRKWKLRLGSKNISHNLATPEGGHSDEFIIILFPNSASV